MMNSTEIISENIFRPSEFPGNEISGEASENGFNWLIPVIGLMALGLLAMVAYPLIKNRLDQMERERQKQALSEEFQ